MNDLFRFSVVRPTTRASATTLELSTDSKRSPTAQSLQVQLQAVITALGAIADPEDAWARMEPLAVDYILQNGTSIVTDPLWSSLRSLNEGLNKLLSNASPIAPADLNTLFETLNGVTVASVVEYSQRLSDLFIAAFIARRDGPKHLVDLLTPKNALISLPIVQDDPSLTDIADRLRTANIFAEGMAALTGPVNPAASLTDVIQKSLAATILFPPDIFCRLRKPTFGVGFRELHVVRQHIRRYELSEIGRVENILKGELRDHIQRHRLSTEQDTFTSSSTTTENDKELTSDDRTDIKNESEDQLKEDTKVDGGVHASYDGGSFKLQTSVNVSYDQSSDKTKKYSADVAKDVTQKAVSKVTQTVTQSQTTKIIEVFADFERQKFDNVNGQNNVSGIYQWIEKVYLSQVFNLGRHMLLDLMVPEPAANLLALATLTSAEDPPPTQPHPLGTIKMKNGQPVFDQFGQLQLDVPLNPLSLTADNPADQNYYGTWVAYYAATSITPPPDGSTTITKPLSFEYKDDDTKTAADTVQIPDGYYASLVTVVASAICNDGKSAADIYIEVSIGGTVVHLAWPQAGSQQRLASLTGSQLTGSNIVGNVGFTVYAPNINEMVINIQVNCLRASALLDQWRLQTYEKIAAAYENLQTTYTTAMAGRKMATKTVGPLGAADPDANRLTERIELKRLSVAVMDQNDKTVRGTDVATSEFQSPPQSNIVDPNNPVLPEIDLIANERLGSRVRWFEEAFEWENLAYVLYPYFWGRRTTWVSATALNNDDPLFLNFLQAGYARVVIPVRLGFERAVHCYLYTGLPWRGGELPPVGDKSQNPLYLDVAEELKALTDGGESGSIDEPIGEPWEYTLPTTVMKLQPDDQLPSWHRVVPKGLNPAAYSSDAPDGDWTWADGDPP